MCALFVILQMDSLQIVHIVCVMLDYIMMAQVALYVMQRCPHALIVYLQAYVFNA